MREVKPILRPLSYRLCIRANQFNARTPTGSACLALRITGYAGNTYDHARVKNPCGMRVEIETGEQVDMALERKLTSQWQKPSSEPSPLIARTWRNNETHTINPLRITFNLGPVVGRVGR